MVVTERSKRDPHNYTQELYNAYNTPGLDKNHKWWIKGLMRDIEFVNEEVMNRVRDQVRETVNKLSSERFI
jgi:hypothetical protein